MAKEIKKEADWTDEQFENRLDDANVPVPRDLLEVFDKDFGISEQGHYQCEFCGACLDGHYFDGKIAHCDAGHREDCPTFRLRKLLTEDI